MNRWRKKFVLFVLVICLICAHCEPPEEFFEYSDIYKDEGRFDNLTLEPYNLTAPNETESTAWGMRLFGRLVTPTPITQRALSNMVYIIFDCGKCDPDVSGWQKKRYAKGSGGYTAIDKKDYRKDPDYYAGGYFMLNLDPDTEYMIRANLINLYSVPALASTCKTDVPPIKNLHVEKAAAAWFDVRWKEPPESCKGRYYYKFNYVSHDSTQYVDKNYDNKATRFGMYWRNDTPGPRWIWDTLHPCPLYPQEICLFIGEHVRPESTYIISVKPTRFGSVDWEEDGFYTNISAKSNKDWDAFPLSFCPTTGDPMPMWIVILFVILILVVIVIIIVLAEMLRRLIKKKKEREEKEGKPKKPPRKGKKKKGEETAD